MRAVKAFSGFLDFPQKFCHSIKISPSGLNSGSGVALDCLPALAVRGRTGGARPHWRCGDGKKLATHNAHKKKKLQKKRKFVGLSVCSVWSVVFVGTTEYTEGRARRRDYPVSAVSFFVCFFGILGQFKPNPCPSVFIRGSPLRRVAHLRQTCQLPQF
jgi:hypothetical protein